MDAVYEGVRLAGGPEGEELGSPGVEQPTAPLLLPGGGGVRCNCIVTRGGCTMKYRLSQDCEDI